jgi:energy-coupling factor transporter ATP-binding protein EcfA2
MAVYQEIVAWSQTRPKFIQDALRRIISNPGISQNDIDELVLLLKKEKGDSSITLDFFPIENSHLPTEINSGIIYPKLSSIKDPININALHNEGHLQFEKNGLNVIYGNNGSGKSSYSRILKKLCWSRSPNIELKKNVFTSSDELQQVDISLDVNGTESNFRWIENNPTHNLLKSIYVYDTNCGDIYLNNENPTEYKPVGIDLLEKLVPVLNNISQKLDSEIALYNTQKPQLNEILNTTISGKWYNNIESELRANIDGKIQFTQSNIDRKQELHGLINAQNPQQNIQNLTGLKGRLENYAYQFEQIEDQFSTDTIENVTAIRSKFENIKKAYEIASKELKPLNKIEGFGTNPWRTLWDAAKTFAISNGMSDGQNFPSAGSLEKCVLCQQELDESAKRRLLGFNKFILNDVSTQLHFLQTETQKRITSYSSINVPPFENIKELSQYITSFQILYSEFVELIENFKKKTISFLTYGGAIDFDCKGISPEIKKAIENIDKEITKNRQLLNNRDDLISESNELLAKEFLFNNKVTILRYFDELKYKAWIRDCQSLLNTAIISRKIGELMEQQAVKLQHQEFISHLNFFNSDLVTKVSLSKTRTTQGSTFQKCELNGLPDTLNSVLSEGEQKIISLSNFLAECTIEGKKNTIIFDDPVNSLDMNYRDLIGTKIVELSKERQIIVLTHDLSFLRLLIDTHKEIISTDCNIIGIDKHNEISGIVTDEIPYLAKNVDERVDSIRRVLREYNGLHITDSHNREVKLDSARKRFRMLLERSVEEILSNKTYQRFSKNIHLKKGNLSSYIVTEQSDIDFLLGLYGKYSVSEHDGGTSTLLQLPNKSEIEQDIRGYMEWKTNFKTKLRAFIQTYN